MHVGGSWHQCYLGRLDIFCSPARPTTLSTFSPLPTAQCHSPPAGHARPGGSSPGWWPWAEPAFSHGGISEPDRAQNRGVSRAFQSGSKTSSATVGDFQTHAGTPLPLRAPAMLSCTQPGPSYPHTQYTHLQTRQAPCPQRICISDAYLWLVYFRKKGKEPQQIQTAITSAVITHTVTLQKIKFHRSTKMCFLIKRQAIIWITIEYIPRSSPFSQQLAMKYPLIAHFETWLPLLFSKEEKESN